jgi:hypothetical protein
MLSLPVTSKKLKLTSLSKSSKTFELMLNPEYYSVKSTIRYKEDETANDANPGYSYKYTGTPPREINIGPIILDVTGAIPFKSTLLDQSITKMIENLEEVVYDYDGDTHQPPLIKVEWGSNSFEAKLLTIDVKYTLFAENGDPLRAEISLSMREYISPEEIMAKRKKSSPDLTHLVEVKDGDTLPLMCNRVYKDCSYYREVAEINGLDDFCTLTPGTFLYFPPLVD